MTDSTEPKKPRGFAAMSKERQLEIAKMGGKASGANFKHDRVRAAILGKKGGHLGKPGTKKKHENQI